MKRLLLVLVAAMVLVGGVVALTVDLQEREDYLHIGVNGSTTSYASNISGGNSYVYEDGGYNAGAGNNASMLMDYMATTLVSGYYLPGYGTYSVSLLDGGYANLYAVSLGNGNPSAERIEIVVSGGTAKVYKNGNLFATSGALAKNPSFVRWYSNSYISANHGQGNYDDFIFGNDDDTTVLGMPELDKYYLKKDIVTPAASGFYNATTNALIASTTFSSTFSRSNLSGEALTSQPIYLIYRDTGTAYETEQTGTASAGTVYWHITNLTGSSAPYGWYQTKLGTTVSDTIAYIANGANIYFDADEYSAGDTATLTYLIDSGYYDTSTYSYSIKIVDVYGSVIDTQNIATSSGTVTYTWTEDNTQGVYYAEIIGAPIAGGDEVLYNYDYATLSAYFDVTGYVHDAETELPIEGAFVNASQGSTMSNATSGFDGNYTVNNFMSGVLFGMNTSATGYQTYWNNFTPFTSHTLHINVTLLSTSPLETDITLGGVCRDTTYGRPIPNVGVDIWNATDGQYWTATANSVGFYNKTSLTEDNTYSIEGAKLRYLNSTIYKKLVVAS